jgi:hypothetical protein
VREAAELRRAIRAYLESPPIGSPDLSSALNALDAALEQQTGAPTPHGVRYANSGTRLTQAAEAFRQNASAAEVTIKGPLETILSALASPGQRQAHEVTEPPSHSGQIPEGGPPEFAPAA